MPGTCPCAAAHLDADHGFFNGTSVFLAVDGREREPRVGRHLAPPGAEFRDWRLATTLPREPGTRSAGDWSLRTVPRGRLRRVDRPPGRDGATSRVAGFDVGGCRHEIVVTAAPGSDLDRRRARPEAGLRAPDRAVRTVAPTGADASATCSSTMASADGYGGLEHRARDRADLCSRRPAVPGQWTRTADGYRTFLGLASHEYFHTWNVKRIKPAAFDPYDWRQETLHRPAVDLRGVHLLLRRPDAAPGRIDRRQGLSDQLVERAINRVAARPGRLVQSVAESSFDAWMKYYRQDENSAEPHRQLLRQGVTGRPLPRPDDPRRTRSRRSLDDVMRSMWQR